MIWIKRLNAYGMSNWIILLLFVLSFLSMLAQMAGLGIFLPIFEFIFQDSATQTVGNQSILLSYVNLLITSMNISVTLESLLIVAFIFYLISQIALFIIAYANAYFVLLMVKNIKNKFLKFYLDADSEYYDQVKIGDFINISTTELNRATVGVIAPIRLMVAIVSAFGSFVILLMLSYELTLYIILIILVMLPYPMILVSRTTKVGRKHTETSSIIVSFLLDRLRSPRLVRLSGTRKSEIREYSKITETQRSVGLKSRILKEKIGLTFEPAIIFSSLIVLYIAITYLGMSSSSVVLFMVITIRLVPIIRNILVQKQTINMAKGSIESIDSLLLDMKVNEKPDNFIESANDSYKDIKPIKNIQLKNVSYRYSNIDSEALSNISLTFDRGTLNAIIGPSGSGKSTLIDIISTYRKPNNGTLFFGRTISTDFQINNLISYVPQQPQIFDGQIIDHISYGMPNKSSPDSIDAAKLSGAHDFIMDLENKYQTVLNNNGDNLSGGQRYRVDMARALLSDAPILILDEPTSALDYESKDSFVETLKKIKKETDKIVIVITHNFSIMPVFDSIVLLEDGKMTAQSTHVELINISSWYANGIKDDNEKSFNG